MTSRPDPRSPAPPLATLNANQRRHYEVLFGGLERTLATLERAGAAGEPRAGGDDAAPDTFTVAIPDLPPGFAGSAGPIIGRIRQTLRDLRASLSLNARPVSQRQVCRALVTSEIIRIEESYARSLRGYGSVDPSVAESLDPVLRAMGDDLRDLAALLNAPRRSTA